MKGMDMLVDALVKALGLNTAEMAAQAKQVVDTINKIGADMAEIHKLQLEILKELGKLGGDEELHVVQPAHLHREEKLQ